MAYLRSNIIADTEKHAAVWETSVKSVFALPDASTSGVTMAVMATRKVNTEYVYMFWTANSKYV